MSSQLDILALEPFYGGDRRLMLEAVIRCSRHRWTLLKLPPRRIERRLTAAAHWFSEQLSRHWVGKLDLVFTSEAMNLADLFRLMPHLQKKPSVVYFHNNQLPAPGKNAEGSLDLVNLSTANAAGEIWFNSHFHQKMFLDRAKYMIERHPELSGRSPLQHLIGKSHLFPPPVDFSLVHEVLGSTEPVRREPRTIFLDTREADIGLLNRGLAAVSRRAEKYTLITIGPTEGLAADLPRTTLGETDDVGQIQALRRAGIYLSTKQDCPYDHHAVLALHLGCWPIVPDTGVYAELIPTSLHDYALYEPTADAFTARLQDAWHMERPDGAQELKGTGRRYDAINACKAIDERIGELVAAPVPR